MLSSVGAGPLADRRLILNDPLLRFGSTISQRDKLLRILS